MLNLVAHTTLTFLANHCKSIITDPVNDMAAAMAADVATCRKSSIDKKKQKHIEEATARIRAKVSKVREARVPARVWVV